MFDELKEKIEEILEPLLERLSVEVVELNLHQRGKTMAIDLIADKKYGGITIDECAALNRELNFSIESKQLIEGGDFTVEVSSPGLDRPLKIYKDFLRVQGKDVRFHLSEPVEDKIEFTGEIKEVEEDRVVIDTKKKQIVIPLNTVHKAVQVL